GHQGIIAEFGGKIHQAPEIMHGKTSEVELDTSSRIFKGLPQKIKAMRYHSLIGSSPPKSLKPTAHTTKDNLVMAVEHVKYPIFGIQFHPESFKTPTGSKILRNFLQIR
ncbi:MAG: gamma-glutamyl-gamma-aminobutyrate hydrolase family protein, partial [Patescibacteria group bacterium]